MGITDILNTGGVAAILLAFVLQQTGRLSGTDRGYLVLNLLGSAMACGGSYLLQVWPFVVLEGVWALVSLYGLIKRR